MIRSSRTVPVRSQGRDPRHGAHRTARRAVFWAMLWAAAAASLRAQSRAPAPADCLLLLGNPAAELLRIPGVEGQFGLDQLIACAPGQGSSVSSRLLALRTCPSLTGLGALH